MENKICVYAIAKNEAKNVKTFVQNMREADAVVVLDTGSTDNTVELLREEGVIYGQTSYDVFKFDVARNDAMKLVPDWCNILVAMDLDERLNPGWSDYLRENWVEGYHTRANYHVCNRNEAYSRTMSWIHNRDWHWQYPVHESLVRIDTDKPRGETLMCEGNIVMRHYPDSTKSRDQYHDLLQLRLKEYPEEPASYNYWLRHCAIRRDYKQILTHVSDIERLVPTWNNPKETVCLYNYIGDSYCETGNREKGIEYYRKAIELVPMSRRAYVSLSNVLIKLKRYSEAIDQLNKCQEKSVHDMTWTWLDNESMWTWQVPYNLSICYYNLGKRVQARECIKEAYAYAPTRATVKSQYNLLNR